jgi:hypothetical protein
VSPYCCSNTVVEGEHIREDVRNLEIIDMDFIE